MVQNGRMKNADHELVLPPLQVWMDNQSAIAQIGSSDIREASKHIQVRYYWLKDTASLGYLKYDYIKTGDNLADMHTKCFTERKTLEMRRMAGMVTAKEFSQL